MLKEERLKKIISCLQKNGSVENASLMSELGVSDMTIRRDLSELESLNVLYRIHGGALLKETSTENSDMSMAERASHYTVEKDMIARESVKLLDGCRFVYLDSGTTIESFARQITQKGNITLITNALNVASQLLKGSLPIIMIGGEILPNTWGSLGPIAEAQLASLPVDAAFMACNAVSKDGDILIADSIRCGIKQQAMKVATKKYLLLDSSKFYQNSLISFAKISDFDAVITDYKLEDSLKEHFASMTKNFIVAQPR